MPVVFSMKKIRFIFVGILILATSISCQSFSGCTKVYNLPEITPNYQDDKNLMKYFKNEFITTIHSCMKRDKSMIASLHLVLTINTRGEVSSVDFRRLEASEESKQEIISKLKEMKWNPGLIDGKPVCSRFNWSLSCIKWG
jgi:hypothetical protein